MAKKLALAIGIEHYPEESGQEPVKYALNDLEAVCRYFVSAGFKVTELKDEQADINGIFTHLENFFDSVQPADTVVIFYAGHGQYSDYGGFLVPHSYKKNRPVNESNCISFSSINDRLKRKKPGKFLMLLDTCYSGHAATQIDTRKGRTDVRNTANLIDTEQLLAHEMSRFTEAGDRDGARAVLTSCRSGELSWHDDEFRHGVFTHFLLRGFAGGAGLVQGADGKPGVNLAAVLPWVQEQVREFSLERDRKQHPRLKSKIETSFILPLRKNENQKKSANNIVVPPELTKEMKQAKICLESGHIEKAQGLVKKILDRDPLNWEATVLEQDIAIRKAREEEKSKREKKQIFDTWLERGSGFLKAGQLDKAEQCFGQAQQTAPFDNRVKGFLEQLEAMKKSHGDTTLAKLKSLFNKVDTLKKEKNFFQLLHHYDLIESIYPGNLRVPKERKSALIQYFYARAATFITEENNRIQKELGDRKEWHRKLETLKDDYEFVGMGRELKEVTEKLETLQAEINNLEGQILSSLPEKKAHRLNHNSIKRFCNSIARQTKGADPYLKESLVLLTKGKSSSAAKNSLDKKIIDPLTGAEFVYLPPGSFMMGSPEGEKGRENYEDLHKVTLSQPFYMQTTQVTQALWKKIMRKNPSVFKGDDLPVENVSWDMTQEFISKLNKQSKDHTYSLPTEAQWEYACRAGSTSRYSFGDDDKELEKYAWYDENSGDTTHPVGELVPNAWGLYDMHGNVWEWCSDGAAAYPSGPVTDPKGDDGADFRVFRGGSWGITARYCRSAYRFRYVPGYWYYYLGLRLVLLFSGQK